MHTNYDVETLYDNAAVNAMTKMTYDLYHPEISGRIYLISCAMMIAGAMGSSYTESPLFTVLLILGCLLITGAEYGAKSTAKQIIASMNGNFPLMKFSFRQDNIVVTTPKETGIVHYKILTRLAENRQYFFLFSSERAAYVIDKNRFTSGSTAEFKEFIQKKTNCTFETSPSIRNKLLSGLRKK